MTTVCSVVLARFAANDVLPYQKALPAIMPELYQSDFMKDAYQYIAPVYDAVASRFLRKPHDKIVALCRSLGASTVLDVGCGTGLLLRKLDRGVEWAVGMDVSPAMLCKARDIKRNRDTAAENALSLVLGDMAQPPLKAGCVDAVIFSLVLHETQRSAEDLLEQALLLAHRVIVLDWRMPERNMDYLGSFWVPIVERLAGKEHFARYRKFMQKGGLRGLAERTGTELVHEESLHLGSLIVAVMERKNTRQ